jgi:hypothetical protein
MQQKRLLTEENRSLDKGMKRNARKDHWGYIIEIAE